MKSENNTSRVMRVRSDDYYPKVARASGMTIHSPDGACPWGLTFPDCGVSCANEVRRAIMREDPQTVAAVMANGHTLVPEGFWGPVKQACAELGVLFIVDEVLSGFGRMGRSFGMHELGIVPELTAFAKGVNGGYAPLGGVLVHEKIHEAIFAAEARFHSQFGGYATLRGVTETPEQLAPSRDSCTEEPPTRSTTCRSW